MWRSAIALCANSIGILKKEFRSPQFNCNCESIEKTSTYMSTEGPTRETPEEHDRHVEEELDEALAETFPASDPPSFPDHREQLPEHQE
jgi:hypothetical protein